jgi:outer membrane usher protein
MMKGMIDRRPASLAQSGMVRTPLSCLIAGVLLFAPRTTLARDYYFSPSSLEGDAQSRSDIDLSLFSKSNAQLPGVYASTIMLNKQKLKETRVTYVNGPDGALRPQLTPALLKTWGVRIEAFPTLAQLPPDAPLRAPLGDFIPAASAAFDFNSMTLHISMPQAAIDSESQDYIDPSRWDDGVPVAFADYAFSGSQHIDNTASDSNNQYLNLRSGANLGGWRLRNYSTFSSTDGEQSWQTINTWIQHDIDALRAQFTAGESSTRGDVFDSVQYNGINITSDQEMLPYSQRGFAPVIRGVASSNAEVSVRQNGYLIYQASVAPGAFEIRDLYSTTNSGDLDITVKEADGTEHHFTQPYSSLAIMQRPGHVDYELTVARYRSDSGSESREPEFAQGSLSYGINNTLTVYGGLTVSADYVAVNSGLGVALGELGSVSTDVTWAQATLDNDKQSTGQSWRILYSGKIDATDTNFTLAGYRYSTEGYYSFADANQKYDGHEDDWAFNYNKRNRLQASISQTVLGSSLYFNGYQQDYWGSSEKERSVSAGINRVIAGVSYHLAWTYSQRSDSESDRMFSFGFSMPLSKWLPNSWASYNISNTRKGDTRQSLGVNGTLLDDQRLNYALQQSHSNHGGGDGSSLYGSYRSQYANLNAGYEYSSEGTQQLSYGMSGAVVVHPQGITLSQPLGDEFAIVHAEGASGIRFQNHRGVQTDAFGNAIIPSLTAYQLNNIRIDTSSLPEDVDTNDTAVSVIPSRNAAVKAIISAHVGYRALITLTRPGNKTVPFGAIASLETPDITGIVDDSSTLYLAGIGEQTRVLIKWGESAQQQCTALVAIADAQSEPGNAAGIHMTRALCQ